ncbi:MAG TPA: (Fe-S)-binding protein [Kofleriaceae bacterium]|nr:(Fe-S)-binding protein [Kofleriaceae bacterium]
MSEPFSSSSVAKQLDYCTYCPKMCRHSCPVSAATGRETLIPQAKMDRLNQARKGNVRWSHEDTENIWACTGCRQCTTYCLHENEPGLVLLSGRAEATRRGAGHPALESYPDRFRNRDERLVTQLREHVPFERISADANVGFWPGCDSIDKSLGDVSAALELFDRSDAEHVRVVDAGQACAGYPLLAAGYPDMFRWHAAKVAKALARFKTVIVNCSACVYTLRSQYRAEGVELSCEILATSEFLAQSATRLPAPARKKQVYYHDPCYLARYSGVIEAPRRVLSQVAEVREFAWSGTDTECCGGGGLLPKTMPDVADAMARRRLRDVANRGGGTVVTSCGTCSYMLKQNAPNGVEVRDLPTAVLAALDD